MKFEVFPCKFPALMKIGSSTIIVGCQNLKIKDRNHYRYFIFFTWYAPLVVIKIKNFPWERTIFCCNCKEELNFIESLGAKAILCSLAAISVDLNIFMPTTSLISRSAIYNAGMMEWKNHILCSEIEDVAFIYYKKNLNYENKLKNNLKAEWLNEKNGVYKRLSKEEVKVEVSTSGVGLCLSKIEGPMFASTEYLLCGKPVVSVFNKGGRDHFYEPEFVRIVEPNSRSVRNSVDSLLKCSINKNTIYNATLSKILDMRSKFYDAIGSSSWYNFHHMSFLKMI